MMDLRVMAALAAVIAVERLVQRGHRSDHGVRVVGKKGALRLEGVLREFPAPS